MPVKVLTSTVAVNGSPLSTVCCCEVIFGMKSNMAFESARHTPFAQPFMQAMLFKNARPSELQSPALLPSELQDFFDGSQTLHTPCLSLSVLV